MNRRRFLARSSVALWGPVLSRSLLSGVAPLALGAMAATPAHAAGGTLKAGLNADIRGTNPFGGRDQNTDAVLLHCAEGLVAFRENAEIGPMLADSWSVGEDGKTYRFTLREGVTFHNGAPLTAEDVVWIWRKLLDPATQWRGLPDFDGHGATKVVDVAAPDAQTVVFTLDRPNALFLVNMARPDYGESSILHRDSWKADGSWSKLIGTGPFTLGSWQPGQSITLDRFPGYASRPGPRDGYTGGKHALVDRVQISVIPDPNAMAAAIISGGIDVSWPVSPTALANIKGNSGIEIISQPSLDMYAVLMQTRDPLLRDVRIRRALAMSISAPDIADGATHGTAAPNSSAVPVSSPFYTNVEKKAWPYDPDAAQKLLTEAGYHGQPIKLIANTQYPIMNDAAVLVQAMAQQAGLALEIELTDWATQLDRYSRGDYQAMVFGFSPRLDLSQSFDTFMGPKATQPRKVWDDGQAQALLTQSMQTLDHAKRQAIFDQLHRLLVEQVPLIPLVNSLSISAKRSAVSGYKSWPGDAARYWDVGLA